jgi:acyl-CoA thioesterase-1
VKRIPEPIVYLPACMACMAILLIWGTSCSQQGSSIQSDTKIQQDQDTSSMVPSEVILFFGNSLTAGYGVNPEDAFPALLQLKLDSLSLPFKVNNAGLSGETTASGVNRIEWVLREPVSVMVLELGGNDGLRGIDPEETKQNLQEIMDRAWSKYPNMRIILAGMEAPPNMGNQYTTAFRSIFLDLAVKNDVPLIPFLLEGVAGEPEFNLEDGIHPNEAGHKIVADNVWEVLEATLENYKPEMTNSEL